MLFCNSGRIKKGKDIIIYVVWKMLCLGEYIFIYIYIYGIHASVRTKQQQQQIYCFKRIVCMLFLFWIGCLTCNAQYCFCFLI